MSTLSEEPELTRWRRRLAVACVCAAALSGWRGAAADAVAEAIGTRIDAVQFAGDVTIAGAPIAAQDLLPELYAARGFRPLWTDDDRIREFLTLIERAPEHGLMADDYLPQQLQSLLAERAATGAPAVAADLDILLTESFARYAYHLIYGKVDPSRFDGNINFRREFLAEDSPVQAVQAAIASPRSFVEQLEEALPRRPVYRTVQASLAAYRRIEAAGGWPAVPPGSVLRAGDVDPRVAVLRRRLASTGDLAADARLDDERFDDALRRAVVTFQERHLLDADGIVGGQTLAALNVPVADRIDQLRLTLERLRWVQLDFDTDDDLVVVNIARFRLYVIQDGALAFERRVMVGTEYRQTPVFRGDLRYMELNPTWTVPPGILRKDTLPAIQRDVAYLAQKNMVVLDREGRVVDPSTVDWRAFSRTIPYTIRQQPGPDNALGRIKFIFPNPHFVFLHDTPSRELFDRPERAFSSGCIRVEDPLALAALLAAIDGQDTWTPEALAGAVASERTQRIHFTSPIPVLIVYLTAGGAPGEPVFFGRDIYGRDARLLPVLDGPVTIARPQNGA